jgi:hypothetical protein
MIGRNGDGWEVKAISLKSMWRAKREDEFLNLFVVSDVLIMGVLR